MMAELTPQEQANGFVRPLRTRVVHTFCGRPSAMSPGQAEDMAKDPASPLWSTAWCAVCGRRLPLTQFIWLDGQAVGS